MSDVKRINRKSTWPLLFLCIWILSITPDKYHFHGAWIWNVIWGLLLTRFHSVRADRTTDVRHVASSFLVSPDSQVDEALADPIIFQIIFYQSKWRQKGNFFFHNDGLIGSIPAIPKGLNRSSLSGQLPSPRTKAKKEHYRKNMIHLMTFKSYMNRTV